MKPFQYAAPRTVEEAVEELSRPGRARVLAGGTDLLVRLKRGDWVVDRIVNLKKIEDLSAITDEGAGGVTIGALVTMAALVKSAAIVRRFPLLIEAALQMASPQVRCLATVGGNLCNASPAADMAPPLMVLGASLRIAGPRGSRDMPIESFFTGPGACALEACEILTHIRLPASTGPGAFLKFSPRRAMDLAIVNVACRRSDGRIRLALGAVAPTPILVPPSPEQAVAACSPIDDLRASAQYRRHLVAVLAGRALERVSA
jgi:carbon-monoxide dehydrogenase medium subunit